MFEEEVASLGLRVNRSKSELVCLSRDTISLFPAMRYFPPIGANLIGSSIGDERSIDFTICKKV